LSCHAGGGQWVAASETKDDRGFAQRYWQDTSTGGKLLDASMLIPGLGLGGLAIRGGIQGIRHSGKIANLMKKALGGLKKTYQSTPTMRYADTAANRAKGIVGKKIPKTTRGPNEPPKGATYNKQKKQWEMYDTKTKTWKVVKSTRTQKPVLDAFGRPTYQQGAPQFSPLRAGMTTLGVGGIGAGQMMGSGTIPNQAYDDRMAAINANINKNVMAAQKDVDTTAKTAAEAKAEKERVANLGFFDRMKEPGYWDKSMSGDPHDTRLSRIAQLTSYLGKTPKLRALEKNPQDRWSEQAQSDQDSLTALAQAQATLMGKSPYGKPSVSNIGESIFEMVKDRYGDTWKPFDEKDDDEIEKIATAIAIKFTELVNANPVADRAQMMEEAFTAVESEQDL